MPRALLLRVNWRQQTDGYPEVEAKLYNGPDGEFRAVVMKAMMERAEPGYSYVVVPREPIPTRGVG